LEEPELSLNSGIVTRLAPLISRIQRQRKRQVIISTHSADLLSEKGIGPEEVLMFIPSSEGTLVRAASSNVEVRLLLESGFTIADAVLPFTSPMDPDQLQLLFQ
jgi:predicted ATPase